MRKHAIDFRAAEVSQVMRCWRAVESVSLVGVGSVGKSNLLQHLADHDVQAHYLGADSQQRFRAINIDPNMLVPLRGDETDIAVRVWAGYELMMHRLYVNLYPFDIIPADDARQFYAAYQALQDGTNPLYAYMGLRYFELGLDLFLRAGLQIVFMFDEFEEMLARLPVKFFQTLRGLRDQHKNQLSYVTFTRSPLERVAEKLRLPPHEFEPFKELFSDNVIYVGPYSHRDADAMLCDMLTRHGAKLADDATVFLLHVSGGFAGLLRAGCHYMMPRETSPIADNRDKLLNGLLRDNGVHAECQTIWDSLTPPEQIVLMAVARRAAYAVDADSEHAVALLVRKKLLSVDRRVNQIDICPPLFRHFVEADMIA
jgi:hypothetical protein